MSWAPDRAVVLSLARRPDRRAYMAATIGRLGFPAEIVYSVDGETVDVPSTWRSSPGSYGCAQSHRAVLADATGSILVLEDDAHIPADFAARLETVLVAAPDWEVIRLGGEHIAPAVPHTPGVVRCSRTLRTIGYIARGHVLGASVAMIDRCHRHWDQDWMVMLSRYRTYAPDPFIVRPTGSPSDIPDSTP